MTPRRPESGKCVPTRPPTIESEEVPKPKIVSSESSSSNSSDHVGKRRKTGNSSFFYPGHHEALDPAYNRPPSSIEQENNILITQDIGKQYQLVVKDFQINIRDNRIRAKDARITELEEANEAYEVELAALEDQNNTLLEFIAQRQEIGEKQAQHIRELLAMVTEDRTKLTTKDGKIQALTSELGMQKARMRDLEGRALPDVGLDWVFERLGLHSTPQPMPLRVFPFMKLPPEVRNMLYKKCLIPQHPIDFWPIIADDAPHGMSRASILRDNLKTINVNLLRVSRQVHAEAVGILYGCNRFRFSDIGGWTVLEGFLFNLHRNCQYLSNISVVLPEWYFLNFDEAVPLELDPERATREMQPVIGRFHLTVDSPIGPSLHPISSSTRACEIMVKLPALQSLTMIVPYNVRIHDFASKDIGKIMTNGDRVLQRDQKPSSYPKRTIVLLRRPENHPRMRSAYDMDHDEFMGRQLLINKSIKRGVVLKYGMYGEYSDRVSYIIDGEDEEEYEVEMPDWKDDRGIGTLLMNSLKRLIRR